MDAALLPQLYLFLLLVSVVYAVVTWVGVRRRYPVPAHHRELEVVETAFLTGGPRRVVDVAIVAMVQEGRLRASRGGILSGIAAAPRNPVESAVLAALGPANQREVAAVRGEAMRAPAVQQIGDRLAGEGLLLRPGDAHALRRARRPLQVLPVAMIALHLLSYWVSSREADVSELLFRLSFSPLFILLFANAVALAATSSMSSRVTPAGRRQVKELRVREKSSGAVPTGLGAVALFGAAYVVDEELRAALEAGRQQTSSTSSGDASAGTGSWCGNGSCGSGSGGCGGGGCGSSGSGCGGSGGGSSGCGGGGGGGCGGGGGG